MTSSHYDARSQALANCKFLFGPGTELLTILSANGFLAMAMASELGSKTWTLAMQDDKYHISMELAIEAFHEISASAVLRRLSSESIHYHNPSWSVVSVRSNPTKYSSGFRAHLSSDLEPNGQKVSSETTTDGKTDPENLDDILSLGKSFEMVTADSSVNGNAVEESLYDNEVFVMPEPAVEEAPREPDGEGPYASAIDEPGEEENEEPALSASNPISFNYSSRAPSSKQKWKKPERPLSCWSNDIQPFGGPPAAVAAEEPLEWEKPDPEPVPEESSHEPVANKALPSTKKPTKLRAEKITSYCWGYDAAVAEGCLDMPTSPRALCGESAQEAVPEELQFETPTDGVLSATTKMDKRSKKKDKVLPSFCFEALDVEESLEEVATPVADWENPVLDSVLEERAPDALAEEASSTTSAENSPVDLGSAAAEFTGSDSSKSEEQEQQLYDVYLTVKCECDTYRILATLSENMKAGILEKAGSCYRMRMSCYERQPVRDFCIESAASKDGPIDIAMLGNGDWTDRLKFFAAHTKSGIPELTLAVHTTY